LAATGREYVCDSQTIFVHNGANPGHGLGKLGFPDFGRLRLKRGNLIVDFF
jgi:hypothetical protein